MARALRAQFELARRLLMSADPWLAFVAIGRRDGGAYRLVSSAEHRLARVGDAGVIQFWQASSITVEIPALDGDGSLPRLSIALPNVSRLPGALIEIDDDSGRGDILGQTVSVWLAPVPRGAAGPVILDPAASFAALAVASLIRPRTVSVECDHPSTAERLPRGVFDRVTVPALQGL